MDDEEFKKQVLCELATLPHNLVAVHAEVFERINKLEDQMNARMDAIAQRLDDQDLAHDVLVGKVDRLAGNIVAALEAAEQALDRTTTLTRRVSRLEAPDGKKE